MKSIKFSIVVPVYNVENYLHECFQSIINQNYENFELIIINDGSTDYSGDICSYYALNSSKIKLIDQENGGLSIARNVGISNATGDYIIFIDSDDFVEENSFKQIHKSLVNNYYPEVLITKMTEYNEFNEKVFKDRSYSFCDFDSSNKNKVIDWIFNKSENTWPSVRYIVKHSFIKKFNLSFLNNRLHEDLDWTSRLFLYSNSFGFGDFYWYNHRINRDGSITSKVNTKRIIDVIEMSAQIISDQNFLNLHYQTREIIFKRVVSSVFSSLTNYKYLNQKNKGKIVDALKKNKDIFKYAQKRNHRIFIFCVRFIGFEKTLNFMSLLNG